MNNILKDMLSNETIDINQKGKIEYIEINEITPNESNMFLIKDIDILAENIKEEGLLQPLIIYKQNNKKILHTGHRRLEALKYLINTGYEYSFFGKNITGKVPVIYIDNSEKDEIENLISLIRSNSYRQLSSEEKNKLIETTLQYVSYLENSGKKPKGRTREIISEITGININYIREYLTNKNKTEIVGMNHSENLKENIKESKLDKLIKKLDKLTAEVIKLELDEVDFDEHQLLKDSINDLHNALNKLIY